MKKKQTQNLTLTTVPAIPNTNAFGEKPWNSYRVSVDDIENLTGYDLLANVPDAIEREIEAQSDKIKVSGMYLYSDWWMGN